MPDDTWVSRTATSSLRHNHNDASKRNVAVLEERNSVGTDSMVNPPVNTSSVTIVTTPDSGCGTAEDDSSHILSSAENREPIFIPKLNLQAAIEEDPLYNVTETVPPLDLSEISPPDENTRMSTPSRKGIYNKPRRRRHCAKSSPNQVSLGSNKFKCTANVDVKCLEGRLHVLDMFSLWTCLEAGSQRAELVAFRPESTQTI